LDEEWMIVDELEKMDVSVDKRGCNFDVLLETQYMRSVQAHYWGAMRWR
jgi:hypothetical protein